MMSKSVFYLTLPFLLTGCVGSIISGNTGYLQEDYPDIRNVPERKQAIRPRGMHEGNETASRSTEFQKLEKDCEKMKARNEALREGAFPNSQLKE